MKKIKDIDQMQNLLWNSIRDNEGKVLRTILKWKPIVYYFWEDFAEAFMQERKQKQVFLQSLRLTPENYDTDEHKDYAWYGKEVQHVK